MSRIIDPLWKGRTAYIIGGGVSLDGFNFSLLKGERVIGCNDAYTLGVHIVKICAFGDNSFWEAHKGPLSKYRGWVVTNNEHIKDAPDFLTVAPRKKTGFDCLWRITDASIL